MEIIDEEPKNNKTDFRDLEEGDVISAELYEEKYYFMIGKFRFQGECCFALTALDEPDKGMITDNGDNEIETAEYDEFFEDVVRLINNLLDHGYVNVQKVELEARVKHGN